MAQAFTGSGQIQAIVSAEIAEFESHYRAAPEMPAELALRPRFNPELNGDWFQAVMGIVNSVTMLAIVLTGAALIREREHGSIEHLLVMPVKRVEIILNIPLQGSMLLFVIATALHLFATTSLEIFMSTVAGSMPQFGILLMLGALQVLSGVRTPRDSMPELVQTIMLAAPNTHYVILSQSVLFRGAGLDVVWSQLKALLVIGITLFAFSLRHFRQFLK